MRSPPPKGKMLLIGSEDIEIYPMYCGDGHKCIQCYFNGKYLCSPRFWLYPTLGDFLGYPQKAKSIWGKSAISLSSEGSDGEVLLNKLAGQPPIPMPDGGYVAELTDKITGSPVFHRREPSRITDDHCNKCGYGFLTLLGEGHPNDNYRELYHCPQCGGEQIKDNKLLRFRIPDTVKILLRELREQGLSIRITIKRIQQELGVKLSEYAYYLLLREMGLPLTRKFERGGTVTEAQRETAKRNLQKTPSHRIKALREALVQ